MASFLLGTIFCSYLITFYFHSSSHLMDTHKLPQGTGGKYKEYGPCAWATEA